MIPCAGFLSVSFSSVGTLSPSCFSSCLLSSPASRSLPALTRACLNSSVSPLVSKTSRGSAGGAHDPDRRGQLLQNRP